MLSRQDRFINNINESARRWKRQGHQRRFSVTDLHGIEYQAAMSQGAPAQFYTSISYDFDRFSHWWLKIIVNPYEIKNITEGEGVEADGTVGFNGDGSYSGSPINYSGRTLTQAQINAITEGAKKYGLLPSGVISQLYLESNWGASAVGQADNNWGGMTWSGSGNRPSGVTVTQGSARPANEGGYYNHYSSVEDFLTDYMYLLAVSTAGNNQKMYGVQGKTNIDDYTKGLFREGGAMYDYAASGYGAYLPTMKSIYDGINKANNNILSKIDEQVINGQESSNEDQETGETGETTEGPSVPKDENIAQASKTKEAIAKIESLKGQRIGSGQCYGLVAYYSQMLGGPGLGGGVTEITDLIGAGMDAALIGTDFDWAKYGWAVITPQSTSDLKPGAIANIKSNFSGVFQTGPSGHTALIKAIDGDTIIILEQNFAGKMYVVENQYNINDYLAGVQTIVFPPELADGFEVVGANSGGPTQYTTIEFPDDISVSIDGIDLTPMFKAQFKGEWIDKYAVFPNDKPNEGYDVMMAAAGMTEEEQRKIFTSGEHLVEVSGSMQADVILRVYLKYNHLN